MKKIFSTFLVLIIAVFAFTFVKNVKADEAWDLTGIYTIDFVCTSGCGGTWTHQMDVTSMDLVTGDFSGTGNYHTGSPTWIHSGNVSGSNVDFVVDYDSSSYYVDVTGTIASDGSMSGTAGNASQSFNWSTTAGAATFNRHAEITSPEAGDVNSVNVDFEAYLVDDDEDYVDWAVRQGTCAAGTNTVFGNVDGFSDDYDWVYDSENYLHTFTATADTSDWPLGMYCFVLNPREDSGESNIRLSREFQLVDDTAPLVTIELPKHGDYLNGTVDIYGTIVEDRKLSHYNISVYPGDANFMDFSKRLEQQTVSLSDGFDSKEVYQWNTTIYPDGKYLIRLAARDAAGNRDLTGVEPLAGDDSQHVITVYVDNDQDGVAEGDFCPATTADEPDESLGVNRWIWDGGWTKGDIPGEKAKGPKKDFTMEQTYGCSCEQILDKLVDAGLGEFGGHYKYGCSSSILEDFGWDYEADGVIDGKAFIETVEVPATSNAGVDTINPLVNGQEYLLEASGTYRFANWGDYGIADAEWAYRNDSYKDDPLPDHGWTVGELTYPSFFGLDVLVNGGNVDWGDYSPEHEYNTTFVGDGTTTHFNIYDSAYGDNSGFITVDIFAKLY